MVDEKIDESISDGSTILREWRMIGLLFTKWVYLGERIGIRLIGRPRKRWIDSVNGCSKNKSFKCRASKKNGV